jgi:hypothetical protein
MLDPDAQKIISLLEKNTSSGQRPAAIFQDWLEMTDTALRMLPEHAASVAKTRQMAEDDEEGRMLWTRLSRTYRDRDHFDRFQEAFALLLNASSDPGGSPTYKDTIGSIYMEFGNPSPRAGQFFTPLAIAKTMAMAVIDEKAVTKLVLQRVRAAIEAEPLLRMWLELEGLTVAATGGDMHVWAVESVLPRCGKHFKPVRVLDCCVGSGVMLLAAASCLPTWMVQAGLVQFYGHDIDATAALMANINIKLYGLNGWGLKYRIAGLEMLACITQSDETATGIADVMMPRGLTPRLPEPDFILPDVGEQIGLFSPQTT